MNTHQFDSTPERAGRALSAELLEVARNAGFAVAPVRPEAAPAEPNGAQAGACGTQACGCDGEPAQVESTPAMESTPQAFVRSALAGGANPVKLPRRLPIMKERKAQSNIPDERSERDRLRSAAVKRVAEQQLVPPISLRQLQEHSSEVCRMAGLDVRYKDYAAVLINNECWREELAQVPFERRLLLIPKCLRVEEHCPAPFDQFGMLCKECGLCSIEDLTREAEELGYAVLIAEGSAIVTAMVETGKVEAIVGVSCLNVLEKCFPHMEAVAIPGMSIPLLQDDCIDTNVDLDQVRDLINLSALDRTYRLDLEGMKAEVREWFSPASIEDLMGASDTDTDRIARAWLARAGKRWRPFLAACMWLAVSSEGKSAAPVLPRDLKKLALAVECFHKASLVHDDIEDGDLLRYGESTLHAEYGEAVAINVGDLLLGEGYRLLSELQVDGEVRAAIMAEAARGHVTLSRGQGAELYWTRNPKPLSSLQVLEIFREKTAPAFEVALRLGALLSGAERGVHEVIAPYSEALGIAYQIRDDVDDFAQQGGESDSDDLADLRPSLILAIAHKRAETGPELELMEGLWRRELDSAEAREAMLSFLARRGIVSKARELCDAYERQAVDALRPLAHASVKGLLRRVIGKIFGDQNLIEGYCGEFEARNAAGRALGAESVG